MEFYARIAAVRGTPSRADDVRTVVRINLEAHDLDPAWLFENLGDAVSIELRSIPPPKLPMDEALEQTYESYETNGQAEVGPVQQGRRRRGTRSSESA